MGQLFFYRLKTEESQVQPFFDNDLIIIIDGEVYNSDQLAKELYPHNFNTRNVNLLICKLYKKYGEKFISKINGMFSLVIIDLNKKKVFASKDKLGLKPLFYYNKNNVFIIASEAKSIINLTDDTKINYQNSLASIFMCGRPPYGMTHFNNIYDVEQSRLLTFDYKDNKIKLTKYFDLEDWINEKKYFENKRLKNNDYVEIFYNTFSEAVDRQLIGTSKFGNLFSAGLDSSFIALLMSQKLNSKIDLYYFESEINNYEKYYKNFISGDKFNLNKLKQDDRNY